MAKIGIVTLCSNDNYGNKLQNYALKKILEKYNNEVYTIWTDSTSNSNFLKKIIKLFILKIKKIKKLKLIKKERKLKQFSKEYLNNDYSVRLSNNLKKIENKYDYFIVGSDQVWNYKCTNDFDFFLLKNIDKNKKLTYAPSFGVYDIPKEYHSIYQQGLCDFKYISVREERGKDLIIDIAGRNDTHVLLDPTMLLDRKEWEELEAKPKEEVPPKYILTYFLGSINNKRKEEILNLAKKYNCSIINIMEKNDKFYASSPKEFLYLFHNAKIVLTDSFHACVFSIIYDKTFIIFDREYTGLSMNSRIDTLLSKLKITDRKYNEINITQKNLNHDYSDANKILVKEREESMNFIKKSLNIK